MSAPVWAYQEITVNDGGTIKGKVVYHGAVPKRTILPTKDKEVCGGIRKEPKILVNADNGVQEAVVHLKKVAKGKSWGKLPATPTIDNKECRFVPHVQVVRSGNIEIVNSDPVLHNTHGFYGKRTAFNVALPNQPQRIKKPLRRPGQVRIECDAHGWMLAWVFVADSP
ncbi:MAG: hypothetical protein HKM94_08475, partial [Halobacteria archaeon]|nr:hypothetical protein [Halobacteria archaeon]